MLYRLYKTEMNDFFPDVVQTPAIRCLPRCLLLLLHGHDAKMSAAEPSPWDHETRFSAAFRMAETVGSLFMLADHN